MIIDFKAEEVAIDETDLEVLIIGFYTEENYLMIQQSLDIEGANYHIERDDQSYGGYGGVEKISLSRHQINIELDEAGKANLACDGVTAEFETDDETYELLIEKLRAIFADSLTVK